MLDDGVKDELNIYHQKLADFDSVKQIEIPESLNATLRPYQKQGLNWLNFLDDFNFGGCLADDMGLGKSIQVIAFILSQREKNSHNTNLIVVPTSLIFNWQQELAKFAPSIKLHTIYGADRIKNIDDFDQYEVILTSYGTLLSDIVFLKNYHFNYVFLDESQNIKNPESQRYRAVRLLKSRNKITITGTPIENNTFDLYGQLSFACPGLLGSKQYFKDIYSSPIDKFKSSKRAVELQNKIRPFILRRTKQQVATDLPEKTEMVLYCEMGQQQRNIYNTYEKEFREFISATTSEVLKKTPMNVLKGITKLRQICDSPLLLTGEKMPGDASAKIDTLIEQIEGKMAQHKILVFSQFVTMLDLIRKKLTGKGIAFTYLTGQTRNREAVVNEFQNNPEVRVFLISLKAGGTGLNLTEADYVYLVDPWWNPAVENQAIDRCHRIGQDKKIVAVRLICPGTVEEKIMLMQQNKKALANELIQTDSSFVKSLSKQDLLNLLK
nr:DEAD/DEAH box helicase [Mucilaginibacter sp. SP1R1]